MIRFAALVALFAAAPLFAQTADVGGVRDVTNEERNEDIEVFRRLLNAAFGFDNATSQLPEPMPPYLGGGTAPPRGGFPAFDPGWGPVPLFSSQPLSGAPGGKRVSQAVGPFDGVYLTGSGVVFTLRVPKEEVVNSNAPGCVGSMDKEFGLGGSCGKCHEGVKVEHTAAKSDCATCHKADTVSAPVPLSEWDRVRAAVRGEKSPSMSASVGDAKKPRAVMCRSGDLRELIVGQLHAHAKNVRHLAPTDRVTVVVTFDEVPGATPTRIPTPGDKPGFTPDERQALTLGELHLKQGKYAEAAAAYQKGLVRYRDPVIRLTFPPTVPAAEVPKVIAETRKNVRDLYKSLATAYLQANELDKARAALERATTLTVVRATAGADSPRPRLPAKLLLSVTKADLDRSLKLDDLRKSAHIETSGFPPPAEKK